MLHYVAQHFALHSQNYNTMHSSLEWGDFWCSLNEYLLLRLE